MIEIRGKYTAGKIFTDNVDPKAIAQVIDMCNQEFAADSNPRWMPDIHSGMGCTIGTTMRIKDKVCPNLVGVDEGCGVLSVVYNEKDIDLKELDRFIRDNIPSGFAIHNKQDKFVCVILDKLHCVKHIDYDRDSRSLGTLGGGNHFIEVGRTSEGYLVLTVHSGSRHLGIDVCKYYQEEAWKQISKKQEIDLQPEIDKLKAEGRQQEISAIIKAAKAKRGQYVRKDFAYCEGELLKQYLHDMELAQSFAAANRLKMITDIELYFNLTPMQMIDSIHNYIDIHNKILRKGAISAQKDELLVIPMNMRDGILICKGKGNPDWNYSAPHGAGRIMGRAEAKEQCSLEKYKKDMSGIFTTCVSMDTIDECPDVYKPMQEIMDCIGDTVEIVDTIKPIYSFKAGKEEE